LFDWLKGALSKRRSADEEILFHEVTEFLVSLAVEAVRQTFLEWIRRLKEMIPTNDDYES
jgi:hypothetical protein